MVMQKFKINQVAIKNGDFLFNIFVAVSATLVFIVFAYPIIYVLSASFSSPELIVTNQIWLLPKGLTLNTYQRVFGNQQLLLGYKNTIVYTVTGVFVNLVLTTLLAYPLSRKDFPLRNVVMYVAVFTMFFRGGIIPTYLTYRSLGLVNNFWVMILPAGIVTYNMIIMRTFFQTSIPEEIRESAVVDGCSNTKFLINVVIPLSMPIFAVMILFYGVMHWNQFFIPLIYITEKGRVPLQIVLRQILLENQMLDMSDITSDQDRFLAESIKYAVIVVASLPVIMVYPFVQRYFVKGVMIGAIKG